jgi:phospholipid/cholesterol/gamma-HCH transport system substrate-binding protein
METRANYVWVGTITLALLALLAGVALWVAHLSRGERVIYDIFFPQSVDGLAKGSTVTYAGVPAGQITEIALWEKDPSYVRVRVALSPRMPILEGTSATIQGSFTGVSAIQLNGGIKGHKPITAPGPEGVPVIPPKLSGLGALLMNAPMLVDQLGTLTQRLSAVLSEPNQRSFSHILTNTDKLSANLAAASPQIRVALDDLHATLAQATQTLASLDQAAHSANAALDPKGASPAHQLQTALQSAQAAADALQTTLAEARPAARHLNQTTLPETDAALRDLRATTRALRDLTERAQDDGLGATLAPAKLPDYQPRGGK